VSIKPKKNRALSKRLKENRSSILDAAKLLISEGGWSAAQIINVAESAGFATGTVYRYFDSKAELFAEVLSNVSQKEVDVLNEIIGNGQHPEKSLHLAVTTFVKRAMLNPKLAYALIAEPCEPKIDEVRLHYRAKISEVFLRLIRKGQTQAIFRNDIPANVSATVIVGGFMEGLIGPLSPLNKGEYMDDKERLEANQKLANQIANLVCSSLRN
jgi:AcrR family transcriptional regulator